MPVVKHEPRLAQIPSTRPAEQPTGTLIENATRDHDRVAQASLRALQPGPMPAVAGGRTTSSSATIRPCSVMRGSSAVSQRPEWPPNGSRPRLDLLTCLFAVQLIDNMAGIGVRTPRASSRPNDRITGAGSAGPVVSMTMPSSRLLA
jgi:hypothetical protein